ncbi:MAG: hypothetical protein ABWZ25_08715 [Chitinophagaceae bacterium]
MSQNWENASFENQLGFDTADGVLKKYKPSDNKKFYKQGSTSYEVLEFEPYYNVESRNWQVVLPFKYFKDSEQMFMKLVCLKIAPGSGLQRPSGPPSLNSPFVDTSGTNLSLLSDPVQVPLYSIKEINIQRIDHGGKAAYSITIDSQSRYENKIYFIMLSSTETEGMVFNSQLPSSTDHFDGLKTFTLFGSGCNGVTNGKILAFRDQRSIVISRTNCKAMLVLEFEIHKNNDVTACAQPQFVNYNPLFDRKGLRLINIAEFTN